MAIRDAKHIFSDEQSMDIDVGTEISTNVIRLATGKNYKRYSGAATKFADPSDLGKMRLKVVVTTALNAAGAGTLVINLQKHTTSTTTSGTIVASSPSITTANDVTTLPAGTVLWDLALPQDSIDLEYLGVSYTIGSQNIDAGAASAFLVDGIEKTSEE